MRVLRVPQTAGSSLILECNGRAYDLSRGLGHARRGDLLELAIRGFFEQDENLARVSTQWPAPPPAAVLTPLEPRHVGKILALSKPAGELAEHAAPGDGQRWFSNRSPASLVASGAEIQVPDAASGDEADAVLLHETFLAVAIARRVRACDVPTAEAAIAGYMVASDFTRRSLDGRPRRAWFGESPVGHLALGPAFAPRSRFDLSDVTIRARLRRDDAALPQHVRHTGEFLHDAARAVSALSRLAILHPGDLVLLPTGVALGAVDAGDEVRCSIDGLGELATHVRRHARLRQQA